MKMPGIRAITVVPLIFFAGVLYSIPALQGSGREMDVWKNVTRFLGRLLPPDFSVLPQAGGALLETIRIAFLATFFAMILAVPLAMLSSRTLSPRWLVALGRMLMNAVRTVPSLIWAVLAVAAVGANTRAGVIALTFYSLGYLGKFFADAFESIDMSAARALRRSGAHTTQAFQYAVWPSVRPLVWSHGLWMLEYNIRSAAIIGYVGAGGLGTLLHGFQEQYDWNRFSAVLVAIFVIVTLLDLVGEWARKKLTT
jgi:phosphonate transport system permease protein